MADPFEMCPMILTEDTPEAERNAVFAMQSALGNLEQYCLRFESAIFLSQSAHHLASDSPQASKLIFQWGPLAMRDGAMTLYHFGKALEGIRASFNDVPSIKDLVDHPSLRAAQKKFTQSFPLYGKMRTAIAHSAELIRNAKAFADNAFTGDFETSGVRLRGVSNVMITEANLSSGKFTTTFEGEIISYELTLASLALLHEIRREFWKAFVQCNERRIG